MDMIRAENVSVSFGKLNVLKNVSISIHPQEVVCIIGPSGAGKSTFLKILSGQLEPSQGEVIITPGERLSFLQQDHFKYDEFPVLDTVMMGNARLYEIMKEKEILYNFMKDYNGVLESQEGAMLAVMIPEFTNYDVPHANKIRKIIAKKKMKEIASARKEYFETGAANGVSEDVLKYIWDVQIKRQLGYSFSIPHTVAYSLIALQEMNLNILFPPIYWATACLTVNSGGAKSLEEQQTMVS